MSYSRFCQGARILLSKLKMEGSAYAEKYKEANLKIQLLKDHISKLREEKVKVLIKQRETQLLKENFDLQTKVENLKQQLINAEVLNGKVQVPIQTLATNLSSSGIVLNNSGDQHDKPHSDKNNVPLPVSKSKEKKPPKEKKSKAPKALPADALPVDVSRLDMRVGCIIKASKHPDADSLYVEEVDTGEENHRTVVSGLVNHIPIEQMQNRMVVLLMNLKPAKMRGILSQAMVMCASSPDKVEIINPPSGSVPGDRIIFDGYTGEPDKQLNPKKKVWERIQPDLHTDENKIACYKGIPFTVKDKGVCKVPTMLKSGIK